MTIDFQARVEWYIDHRIEYLQHQQDKWRSALEQSGASTDYEAIKQFLETRGRIQELENIRKHIREW